MCELAQGAAKTNQQIQAHMLKAQQRAPNSKQATSQQHPVAGERESSNQRGTGQDFECTFMDILRYEHAIALQFVFLYAL
jgi:hypothetical protein